MQDSAEEQTLDGVVCGLEDNACVVAVAIDSFNAFDEFVDTCCTNRVFTLGVTLDLPGCLEGVDINGGAVVEDCLGVQANLCGDLAVYFLSFEAETVVGVELVFTLEGAAPDAGTGDNARSSPVEWCNRFMSFGLGYALRWSGVSSCPVGCGVSRDLVRMSRLR